MYGSRKSPYPPHGRSLEIPRGRGVLSAKILEAMYEDKPEFPGGRGNAKQKTFRGGSMDFFWNCTISIEEDFGHMLHVGNGFVAGLVISGYTYTCNKLWKK